MIQVFYDGKCGLCAKEIEYYKGIVPQGIFLDFRGLLLVVENKRRYYQ